MTLRVYNTLSRHLEEFKPRVEGEMGVYVCGLTVYDLMHIGHARTYIAFDAIIRYLRYRGYRVKYVQNITDIDDKIVKRAKERGVSPLDLAREYAEKSREDQESLGLSPADAYPRVSENIDGIIKAVEALVRKKHAYVVDGSVYFDVSSFKDYGKLSNQDTEQLSKHRIEPNPRKRNPLDFALWKKSEEGELGFDSPWGLGRPGWHIECSVMSRKQLGDEIDVHGGALDLVFPHHENEVAQSEALTGKQFVRYWLHTGFLQSSGEKMSKSLGNIIPVREFLKEHSAGALRLFVLQTHYRSPVDYSKDRVDAAEKAFERLTTFRRGLEDAAKKAGSGGGRRAREISEKLRVEFISHMDEDFSTPNALAAVFEAVRGINQAMSDGESGESIEYTIRVFDELTSVLGLDFDLGQHEIGDEERRLVEERDRYRREKNWVKADEIRDLLSKRGLEVTDKSDGTALVERVN